MFHTCYMQFFCEICKEQLHVRFISRFVIRSSGVVSPFKLIYSLWSSLMMMMNGYGAWLNLEYCWENRLVKQKPKLEKLWIMMVVHVKCSRLLEQSIKQPMCQVTIFIKLSSRFPRSPVRNRYCVAAVKLFNTTGPLAAKFHSRE